MRLSLRNSAADISSRCNECGLCREECGFLQKHGLPKLIADSYDPFEEKRLGIPFECSLCGLCSAVCPQGLDPAGMFLDMRREAVDRSVNFAGHSGILKYERRGTSRRYSYYALPEGCDTVFFPGCALPGSKPDKVIALFEHIRKDLPSLGIVLDCCTKPSHDLGRERFFHLMFGELRDYLIGQKVKTVLVACPNCHKVFRTYGEGLQVKTVYEVLAERGLPERNPLSDRVVTIHDPCSVRFNSDIHSAARAIISKIGLTINEMSHSRENTVCCGEGGTVGCLSPDLAGRWGSIRKTEAEGHLTVTYCAGCTSFLGRVTPTIHLVDLVFEPDAAICGKIKISRALHVP